MSSSDPDSDYDYSSTEETEETEESEPSAKNAKQTPPSPPKKETKKPTESESDDSDYSEPDDSEQSESFDESSNPQEKPRNEEKQTPPKSNTSETVTNKNIFPDKSESKSEEESDYSESDDSENTESSTPKKEAPSTQNKKPSAAKEEPKKSTKSSSAKKTDGSESDYSSTYSEKPKEEAKKPSPIQKKQESEHDNTESNSEKSGEDDEKTEDSEYYYSESEKSKEEPKKSAKSSSVQKKQKSESSSKNPKEEQKQPSKSSSANQKTETQNATRAEQPAQLTKRSTNTNSIDLSQPPDFSVDPAVLEEASHKKVDRYGWIQTKEPSSQEQKLLNAELAKEEERSKKWKNMMKKDKWSYYKTRRGFRVVKERTIKGIPNDVRAKAWELLLDDPKDRKPNRGTVQQFFDQGVPSVEHTIRVDIPRTMPNVPEFLKTETRDKLYRILRAYSNASGGGGYFQGMGFHAAIYLLYIKDEEKTFWCLYNLMMGDKHKVKDLYENEFSGLKIMNAVWEVLLEKKFKHVYQKLKDLMVDPMIYTPSWFLCAFLDLDFPPVLRLRIIDRIIVFGSRQLLSLALAIIDMNQDTLSARNAQMDTVLPLLQNPTTASTMKDWREIVKKWDKHYLSKKDYSALFKKAGVKEIP